MNKKRPEIKLSKVFVDHIEKLIRNMFIDNPNMKNEYFNSITKLEFRREVMSRAEFILEEIERTKHLVEEE